MCTPKYRLSTAKSIFYNIPIYVLYYTLTIKLLSSLSIHNSYNTR